jgi:hypothetical protein
MRVNDLCKRVASLIKKIINAVKNGGTQSMNAILKGLKVKEALSFIRADALETYAIAEKGKNAVDRRSVAYHEIGKNLSNIGRLLTGKEQITTVKPNGKFNTVLGATHVFQMKTAFSLAVGAEKLINKLEALDKGVQARKEQAAGTKKPGILESLETKAKDIAAQAATAPPRQQAKHAKAEIS